MRIFIFIFSFFVSSLKACTCGFEPSVEESLKGDVAIFFGEVVAKREYPELRHEVIKEYEYEFKLDKAWVGVSDRYVRILTPQGGGACGYVFLQGQKYLVYAVKDRGLWATNICTRTCHEYQSEDDQSVLNQLRSTDVKIDENHPQVFVLRYWHLGILLVLSLSFLHKSKYMTMQRSIAIDWNCCVLRECLRD